MKSKIQIRYLTFTIVLGLSLAFLMNSCSKSSPGFTPPVTTTLSASIDSAQWYLNNTREGTQPGDYTKGTQAALQAALTSAQTVLTAASTTATQAQVTAATANLNAAIATYKSGIIVPIAASALVAYWKFNGNTNDSSGNGYNGVLTLPPSPIGGQTLFHLLGAAVPDPNAVPGGVPNLTTDRFGNANCAYHFTNGGHIEVPYSIALNPPAMTISLWERQDTAGRVDNPNDCYMIGLDRWLGYKFQTQPNQPYYSVTTVKAEYDANGTPTVKIGTTTGAGPWNHLVVTYDGVGTTNFYINGTLLSSVSGNGGTQALGTIKPISPVTNLSIGTDMANAGYAEDNSHNIEWGGFWTGDMDDVMIYNIALTPTQVTQLYNQQATQ